MARQFTRGPLQVENRTARERLEYDWSDKKDAAELTALNCLLNNSSTTVLFRPGAVRYMDEQSSEAYWEHFSAETLAECEQTRQKSVHLRSTLDAILLTAARDLRTQADRVESALNARIACMDEVRVRLERDLNDVSVCVVMSSRVSLRTHSDPDHLPMPMPARSACATWPTWSR